MFYIAHNIYNISKGLQGNYLADETIISPNK